MAPKSLCGVVDSCGQRCESAFVLRQHVWFAELYESTDDVAIVIVKSMKCFGVCQSCGLKSTECFVVCHLGEAYDKPCGCVLKAVLVL